MSEITWLNLEAEVIAIAMLRPDYVDPYARAGRPCEYQPSRDYDGCIVGQALTSLGVSAAELSRIETLSPSHRAFASTVGLPFSESPTGLRNSNETSGRIAEFQTAQDQGVAWGKCLVELDAP
jgi:hypothetical protein